MLSHCKSRFNLYDRPQSRVMPRPRSLSTTGLIKCIPRYIKASDKISRPKDYFVFDIIVMLDFLYLRLIHTNADSPVDCINATMAVFYLCVAMQSSIVKSAERSV